jgi:S-adenosyl-L-methionine hydrolase (adenosine-forming)
LSGIVTLTTDFSTSDAYVGMMKGRILSIAPDVTIVDLAHDISPHDVFQAAFVIASAYHYFPPNTVHVAVVDPGVGSERRRLALRCGEYLMVGPDNGVFSYAIRKEGACETVEIKTTAADKQTGVTFEGRDVFAPAAARLASGAPLTDIGTPTGDPIELTLPKPRISDGLIEGRVIYIDHFGNCISNIEAQDLEGRGGSFSVSVAGQEIGALHKTYSDVPVGEPVAVMGSLGHLEMAVNQGNLADEINLDVGSPVRVRVVQ